MRTELLLPGQDPFYDPPPTLATATPGTILRNRRVEIAAFGRLPVGTRAWQVAYRTTDVHGAPDLAVTTIVTPRTGSRGILSYQAAIDGVSPRCLPSYALRRAARATGALTQLELPLILAAARRGWTVSVPDHGGRHGHFGAAREPGYRALDAVRAVLSFDELHLPSTTPVALWGYSGGGLATLWAAEVAGDYAPELPIVGAAAGAPVGDPVGTFRRLNGGLFAGFPTIFIAGLRRAYPQLTPIIDRHVDRQFGEYLDDAARRTTLVALLRLTRRDLHRHLHHGLEAFFDEPVLADILARVQPGQNAPTMPVLIHQGRRDEVIAERESAELVRRYRALGADITYRLVPFGWHLPLEFVTAPSALRWLDARRRNWTDREPLVETGNRSEEAVG